MDVKTRFLLRQFAKTNDPHDAVAFAHASLRGEVSEPAKVFAVHVLEEEERDWIRVYFKEREAYKAAAETARQRLNNHYEWLVDDPDHIGAVAEFMGRFAAKNYQSALQFYDQHFFGMPIHVYRLNVL